ncbi:signal transduction histidine kinase, nitrogen specific, NtrB [Desulfobulbus propionicus DSM 2032]|uniref:histidine kinase n=1 Tax=Desulfobulbus propionicus (strain ATCC 33891 / DSM 2032 / VKM B-1956 / 1pr3) TaxID=577650 RepID=A0A7U3YM09_DESPD|nr:ATP-binding protein [Desulfobulbus propionicus]ADW17882.1 signal transduction histidine kinase, nitrogen specific, NtrB [Desulfobulbus propionicus DSM 2032]
MPNKQPRPARGPSPSDGKTKDNLLSSIHKISRLLTRPMSLDTILTSIVKETSQVFGLTRMAIFLLDKDRGLLECKYIHGFNAQDSKRAFRLPYRLTDQDCVETRVVRFGTTIYVKDYGADPRMTEIDLIVSRIMGRVSTIAVPLKIKRDVIGLITADKDAVKLKLTRKDINTFSTFANQASIIIENARLQEQNQKKIKQLLTLQEISQKTSSAFPQSKLFHVITASALKLTRAGRAVLLLLDDEGREWSVVSEDGHAPMERTPLPSGPQTALADRVAATGLPLPDETLSVLAVPLLSEKRVLGVLEVTGRQRQSFSEDDLKLLMIYAGHSASLIRNVRLYGQVMTERNFRENILESSPNSMISVNLKKEISSVNRRTEEMFVLGRENIVGRRAAEVFGEEIARIVDLALDDRAVVNRKEIRRNHQGSDAILGVTSSLLRNHQGSLIGAMLIVRDLTEEKKTEELIRRLDRLTSLGQLSAGIAHEIRNPLASIYFNVQLLAKKLPAADPTLALINDTQKGINRIRALVKGMLDFAKPSLPSLKSGSLERVLRESIGLMDSQLKKQRIEVALQVEKDLPPVVFDAHQIQQVVVNLLLNAMEAMPGGGRVDLVARDERGTDRPGGQVVLLCTDHGPGIPPENLGKIFNPFFTTKADGTGLGLSIVHKILEQHQATVDVISREGSGTTFMIQFPARRPGGAPCIDTPS